MTTRQAVRGATYLAAIGVAVVLVFLVLGGNGDRYRVSVVVPDASYISAGSPIREAGQLVGSVSSAQPTRSGKARLVLQIDSATAEPLSRGTVIRLRWTGSINLDRYVEIDPPRHQTSAIPNGGTIPTQDAKIPVEVDQILDAFTPSTRANLRSSVNTAGSALLPAGPALGMTLQRTPAALDQADVLLSDLGDNPAALRVVVRSTDAVVTAAANADPNLQTLLSQASVTFHAIADRAQPLQQTLQQLPATLAQARDTLGRANTTLVALKSLAGQLAPGVEALNRTTAPLNQLLSTATSVLPSASHVLVTLKQASPTLDATLGLARQLSGPLAKVGKQATTQLACVRPYAPEVAGLASTWDGFLASGDDKDKYAQSNFPALPFDETPLTPGDIKSLFPYLRYSYPDPPGELDNQPWFLPQCGVGPDTQVAKDDPEA